EAALENEAGSTSLKSLSHQARALGRCSSPELSRISSVLRIFKDEVSALSSNSFSCATNI
ncbi:hypothetical protein, partial [Methanosarcina sp.]|uniref:hypothetical protein n=1 Tax=Methanosarcina sp. TaxID=2213 RepID=UPI002AB8029A